MSQKADAATCTWTGTSSTDWATAGNWSGAGCTTPQSADDVVINVAAANQPTLNLTGGNVTINSLSIGSSAASTLTLSNGFTNQLIITGNLTVGGSGTITHTANTTSNTHAIRLSVGGDMSIESGGYVNANGKGLTGGAGGTSAPTNGSNGNASGAGGGNGGIANTSSGGGGGHGGAGGVGYTTVTGGIEHDQATLTEPNALGSGGGGGGGFYWDENTKIAGGAGGNGGGAIKLNISGTLTLNSGGFISANGNTGGSSGAFNGGGGSGGSIWISAGSITGSGTVRANGGAGGNSSGNYYGGGGAGGRIAIIYTTDSSSSFAKTAYGGQGYNSIYGASGSIYTKQDSASYGDLTFNNNSQNSPGARIISSTYGVKNFNNLTFSEGTAAFTISASAEFNIYGRIVTSSNDTFATAFTNSGTFSQNSVTYTSLTFSSTFTNSAGTITLPNLTTLTFSSTNGNTGTITANSLTTLNVNGTSTNSGTFTANSLQNFNITGATVTMDTLYAGGTSRYVLPSTYAMNISSSGTLNHTANGATALYYLSLSAASLTIDGTSKIDVSGKGLTGGAGGTSAPTNGSNGNASGAGGGNGGIANTSSGGGGGHGGAGGVGYTTVTGGIEHDQATLTEPNALGSGGGGGGGFYWDENTKIAGGAGGNGGGAIKLNISGTLTLNSGGFISANGNTGGSSGAFNGGGGSGGSIWISAGSITGSGTVRANGGAGGNSSGNYYGGGGAGGRVSLTFATAASYGLTNTATGGTGHASGANGSIYYNNTATYTSSVIDFTLGRNFTTLDYNKTTTADAISTPSLTVDARAGNTASPDGSWTAWSTGLASGASLDAFDDYRYTQYRVNLASNNAIQSPKPYDAPTANPSLQDISFNYNAYLNQTLTSSAYNSNDSANTLGALAWNETVPSNTNIRFQMQTSSNGTDWSEFMGPDGETNTYFDDSNSTYCSKASDTVTCDILEAGALGDHTNDQYFRYKAYLISDNGDATPTLNSVTVTYVVNANPEFETTATAVPNSEGNVDIAYSVRDKDSETNQVIPSFKYSLDGGLNWTNTTESCLGETDLDAKDVAEPADPPANTAYTDYTATWDMSCEIGKPGSTITASTYEEDAKIRVTVDDGQAANDEATSDSINFTLDTKSPVITGLTLDASVDPAEIAITSSDDSSYEMRLAQGTDETDCETNLALESYIAYDATPTIAPDQDPVTICVQLKDQYNNVSTISSTDSPETPTAMMVQD
ncbi:MAG TPA: hypothetical protein P5232_01710, partial [Candidatus Moranbacteria bacterium]|nr:hypothetical protein [Candidatus Moranbacteria bacterium]